MSVYPCSAAPYAFGSCNTGISGPELSSVRPNPYTGIGPIVAHAMAAPQYDWPTLALSAQPGLDYNGAVNLVGAFAAALAAGRLQTVSDAVSVLWNPMLSTGSGLGSLNRPDHTSGYFWSRRVAAKASTVAEALAILTTLGNQFVSEACNS